MSDLGKFIGGFVVGGMVGGLLGVLLAPRAGNETRQMIVDGTTDTYKKAEASVHELQQKTDQAIDDLQKAGQDVLKKISDSIGNVKGKDDKVATSDPTNN